MRLATWNWGLVDPTLLSDHLLSLFDVLALQEVGNGLKYSALWEGYQTVLGLDQQLMGKGVALLVSPGLQVLRSFQYTDPWVQCVACHIKWGDFVLGVLGLYLPTITPCLNEGFLFRISGLMFRPKWSLSRGVLTSLCLWGIVMPGWGNYIPPFLSPHPFLLGQCLPLLPLSPLTMQQVLPCMKPCSSVILPH